MLINLSNHPSDKWEKLQLEAASKYGEIVDMPFPNILPDWDDAEVETLVIDYYTRCLEKLPKGSQNAVHLAGEFIFCFLLAQMFLKAGVICVTSTSKRIVKEENGEKISKFEFVRFRNYKLIEL